jgi:hypothetical protein
LYEVKIDPFCLERKAKLTNLSAADETNCVVKLALQLLTREIRRGALTSGGLETKPRVDTQWKAQPLSWKLGVLG